MNILGVGPAELVIIFLILMVVAGPKRMVRWAYVAGHYIGKARALMAEASQVIKKELEDAGVDSEITETVTKLTSDVQSFRPRTAVNNIIKTFTGPISDSLNEVGDTPLGLRSPMFKAPSQQSAAPNDTSPTQSPEPLEPASESSNGDIPRQYDSWTPN